MNNALAAYTKTISGKATRDDLNSLEFRQQSFEGVDLIKNLVPESMGKRIEAQMTRQMIEAMPNGQELLNKTVALGPEGEEITLGGALDNAATGIDPVQQKYIDAYTAATAKQARAAEELANAATSVAQVFEGKMLEILNRIGQVMGVQNGAVPVAAAAAAGIPAVPQGAVVGANAAIPGAVVANNAPRAADNNNGGGANFAGFGPITVDEAAKEFARTINVSFDDFGRHVEQLSAIKIPGKIELTGNHVVDVRITGAAAFEALKKDFNNMIVVEVSKAMGKIWNQTGGGLGARQS